MRNKKAKAIKKECRSYLEYKLKKKDREFVRKFKIPKK